MNVRDLKAVLENYSDDAVLQINIADGFNVTGWDEVGIDDEYDKSESFVLTVNVDSQDCNLVDEE